MSQLAPWLMTILGGIAVLLGASGFAIWLKRDEPLWLFLLVPYLFFAVVIAPYQLWRQAQNRVDVLDGKRLDLLSVEYEDLDQQKVLALKIRNAGQAVIEDCYTMLRRFRQRGINHGELQKRPPEGHFFPWGIAWGASQATQQYQNIPGGSPRKLHLAITHIGGLRTREGNKYDGFALFEVSGTPPEWRLNYPQAPGEYELVLEIRSNTENMKPMFVCVIVTYKGGNDLVATTHEVDEAYLTSS